MFVTARAENAFAMIQIKILDQDVNMKNVQMIVPAMEPATPALANVSAMPVKIAHKLGLVRTVVLQHVRMHATIMVNVSQAHAIVMKVTQERLARLACVRMIAQAMACVQSKMQRASASQVFLVRIVAKLTTQKHPRHHHLRLLPHALEAVQKHACHMQRQIWSNAQKLVTRAVYPRLSLISNQNKLLQNAQKVSSSARVAR